ncbi:hypothetical protein DFJ73DRAFT_894142 [Zopfochytrium polystomum]|nr:hypothetical protein DFJ73DRAFT_894142 [Zopfochytrium polystomum]
MQRGGGAGGRGEGEHATARFGARPRDDDNDDDIDGDYSEDEDRSYRRFAAPTDAAADPTADRDTDGGDGGDGGNDGNDGADDSLREDRLAQNRSRLEQLRARRLAKRGAAAGSTHQAKRPAAAAASSSSRPTWTLSNSSDDDGGRDGPRRTASKPLATAATISSWIKNPPPPPTQALPLSNAASAPAMGADGGGALPLASATKMAARTATTTPGSDRPDILSASAAAVATATASASPHHSLSSASVIPLDATISDFLPRAAAPPPLLPPATRAAPDSDATRRSSPPDAAPRRSVNHGLGGPDDDDIGASFSDSASGDGSGGRGRSGSPVVAAAAAAIALAPAVPPLTPPPPRAVRSESATSAGADCYSDDSFDSIDVDQVPAAAAPAVGAALVVGTSSPSGALSLSSAPPALNSPLGVVAEERGPAAVGIVDDEYADYSSAAAAAAVARSESVVESSLAELADTTEVDQRRFFEDLERVGGPHGASDFVEDEDEKREDALLLATADRLVAEAALSPIQATDVSVGTASSLAFHDAPTIAEIIGASLGPGEAKVPQFAPGPPAINAAADGGALPAFNLSAAKSLVQPEEEPQPEPVFRTFSDYMDELMGAAGASRSLGATSAPYEADGGGGMPKSAIRHHQQPHSNLPVPSPRASSSQAPPPLPQSRRAGAPPPHTTDDRKLPLSSVAAKKEMALKRANTARRGAASPTRAGKAARAPASAAAAAAGVASRRRDDIVSAPPATRPSPSARQTDGGSGGARGPRKPSVSPARRSLPPPAAGTKSANGPILLQPSPPRGGAGGGGGGLRAKSASPHGRLATATAASPARAAAVAWSHPPFTAAEPDPAAAVAVAAAELADLRSSLASARAENARLREQLVATEAERDRYRADVVALETLRAALQDEVAKAAVEREEREMKMRGRLLATGGAGGGLASKEEVERVMKEVEEQEVLIKGLLTNAPTHPHPSNSSLSLVTKKLVGETRHLRSQLLETSQKSKLRIEALMRDIAALKAHQHGPGGGGGGGSSGSGGGVVVGVGVGMGVGVGGAIGMMGVGGIGAGDAAARIEHLEARLETARRDADAERAQLEGEIAKLAAQLADARRTVAGFKGCAPDELRAMRAAWDAERDRLQAAAVDLEARLERAVDVASAAAAEAARLDEGGEGLPMQRGAAATRGVKRGRSTVAAPPSAGLGAGKGGGVGSLGVMGVGAGLPLEDAAYIKHLKARCRRLEDEREAARVAWEARLKKLQDEFTAMKAHYEQRITELVVRETELSAFAAEILAKTAKGGALPPPPPSVMNILAAAGAAGAASSSAQQKQQQQQHQQQQAGGGHGPTGLAKMEHEMERLLQALHARFLGAGGGGGGEADAGGVGPASPSGGGGDAVLRPLRTARIRELEELLASHARTIATLRAEREALERDHRQRVAERDAVIEMYEARILEMKRRALAGDGAGSLLGEAENEWMEELRRRRVEVEHLKEVNSDLRNRIEISEATRQAVHQNTVTLLRQAQEESAKLALAHHESALALLRNETRASATATRDDAEAAERLRERLRGAEAELAQARQRLEALEREHGTGCAAQRARAADELAASEARARELAAERDALRQRVDAAEAAWPPDRRRLEALTASLDAVEAAARRREAELRSLADTARRDADAELERLRALLAKRDDEVRRFRDEVDGIVEALAAMKKVGAATVPGAAAAAAVVLEVAWGLLGARVFK